MLFLASHIKTVPPDFPFPSWIYISKQWMFHCYLRFQGGYPLPWVWLPHCFSPRCHWIPMWLQTQTLAGSMAKWRIFGETSLEAGDKKVSTLPHCSLQQPKTLKAKKHFKKVNVEMARIFWKGETMILRHTHSTYAVYTDDIQIQIPFFSQVLNI